MFFSWYIKNKHFKQRSNLSGQIAPFLLVVMVILLIAAIAVIQIGKVSIDKTCTANAADAGSLAAASSWAASLNDLAYKNYDLKSNFDKYRGAIKNKFLPEANYYLTQSALYGKAAQQNTIVGSAYVTAAGIASMIPGGVCAALPLHIAAALCFNNAKEFANESINLLRSYQIMVDLMKTSTQAFQDSQLYKYSEIRKNMVDAYIAAKKEGFQYAFSNSCIQNKLSKTQGDEFYYWLAKTLPDSIEAGANSATYSWQDKNDKWHDVSVTLNLPDIKTYTLWHTKNSYSYTQYLYDGGRDVAQTVIDSFGTQLVVLTSMWVVSIFLAALSATACAVLLIPIFGLAASTIMSIVAKIATWVQLGTLGILIAAIIATVTGQRSGTDAPTMRLMIRNAVIDKSWEYSEEKEEFGRLIEERYLQDTASYWDAEGMMIVAIEDINRGLGDDFWKTKCCVSQTHPRVDLAGKTEYITTKNCSTSKFSGGSMKITPQISECEALQNSMNDQSVDRTKAILDFLDTNVFRSIDFNAWVGSGSSNPCKSWMPQETEATTEKTVNANYAPEIIGTNIDDTN